MSQSALSTIYNDVRLDAPGCPDPLILRGLNRTLRDFCKRVPVLRHTVSIWLIKDRPCYQLDVPAKTKLGYIISVDYEGRPIDGLNETELNDRDTAWKTLTGPDPIGYLMPEFGNYRTYPIPSEAKPNALSVIFSLIPTRDAIDFEEELLDRYEQLLVAGSLSWLLARPKQKWTDLAQAQISLLSYENDIETAAIDQMHNNVKSEVTVKLRPLA